MRKLAAAVWLGVATCMVVSFVFWRLIGVSRPHAAWAVVGLAIVFGPLLVLVACAVRRFILRAGRVAGVGWLLVGATPVVWCVCYYALLMVRAEARESLRFDLPFRVAISAALPYLDLEARVRYPRQTHGQHVTLFDDGNVVDVEQVVVAMDHHLEGMAELLGQPLPAGRLGWVRGDLLGMEGRCIVCWGICNEHDGNGELTTLDRHEMAHALITVLAGPDWDAPMLLVEGWAEHRSADRNEQLTYLARRRRDREIYSLQELIEPEWYGRSSGPAYWQGGPLVHYLIDRFGPQKFFELYTHVRRPTFSEDAAAILGESWEETEAAFWDWVEVEAALIESSAQELLEGPKAPKIELAQDVNSALWEELLAGVRGAHEDVADFLPQNIAFEMVTKSTDANLSDDLPRNTQRFRAVFSDSGFWIIKRWQSGEQIFLASDNDDTSIYLWQSNDGSLTGKVNDFSARRDARRSAANLYSTYHVSAAPNIPWKTSSQLGEVSWRVDRIEKPTPESDAPWIVELTSWTKDDDLPTTHWYEIDPNSEWAEVRTNASQANQWESTRERTYKHFGDHYLLAHSTFHVDQKDGVVFESTTTLRLLSTEEQREVKAEVERIGQLGPTLHTSTIRQAIRVAVLGIPLLAIGLRSKAVNR